MKTARKWRDFVRAIQEGSWLLAACATVAVAACVVAVPSFAQNERRDAQLGQAQRQAQKDVGADQRRSNVGAAAGASITEVSIGERRQALDRAMREAAPSTLKLPDTVATGKPGANVIDPARIANQYATIQSGASKRDDETNEVMVFVSLSMPKESLVRVARDSRKAAGMLVMNGAPFGVGKGMWLRSVDALKPMTDVGGSISLHPDAFERYNIRRVPALVVAPDPQAGCTEDACREYAVVYGDVSIDYALEKLADRKDAIGAIARDRLKRFGLKQ